jgi:hypothetical protein
LSQDELADNTGPRPQEQEYEHVLSELEKIPGRHGLQILWRYLWKLNHPSAVSATKTELYEFAAKGNEMVNDRWIWLLQEHQLMEKVPSGAERPQAYYRKSQLGRDVERWMRKDWIALRKILFFARKRVTAD